MSRADRNERVPRAMIHRRILDVAEKNPDATLEAIAAEVSGASSPLVERVLDEYGDPADAVESDSPSANGPETGTANVDKATEESPEDDISDDEMANDETTGDEAMDDGPTTDETTTDTRAAVDETVDSGSVDSEAADDTIQGSDAVDETGPGAQHEVPMNASTNGQQTANGRKAMADPEISLSDKQRRTLRVLYDQPEAAQGDVAEALDVTRPTVSRRLNSIPGFEWSERRSFARSVFEGTEAVESSNEDSNQQHLNPVSDDSDTSPEPTGSSDSATEEVDSVDFDDQKDTGEVDESEIREMLNNLDDRLSTLESESGPEAKSETTEADESGSDAATVTLSPEMAHKVVHACLNSERLSEDEEMEILRSLMQG